MQKRTVNIVLIIFLIGTILDYGGGLYIKQAVFGMMALFLLINGQRLFADLAGNVLSLIVVIAIPLAISLFHVVFDPSPSGKWSNDLYAQIGSPVYFLIFPAFYWNGVQKTVNVIVKIMAVMAILTLILMFAHAVGWINIFDHTDFVTKYRLATFGIDLREEVNIAERTGLPGFGAAQAFPVAFSLAIFYNLAFSIFLLLAVLFGTQRGQILGLIVSLVMASYCYRRSIFSCIRGHVFRFRILMSSVFVFIVGLVVYRYFLIFFTRHVFLLSTKYNLLISGHDESASIRYGHLMGYLQRLSDSPCSVLWGFGPGAWVFNPTLNKNVFMFESVFLVYVLWYGLFYTILFYFWILYEIISLRRLSKTPFDTSLVTACVTLLIVGNINPVMLTPLAFIFLALIHARKMELRSMIAYDRISYHNRENGV